MNIASIQKFNNIGINGPFYSEKLKNNTNFQKNSIDIQKNTYMQQKNYPITYDRTYFMGNIAANIQESFNTKFTKAFFKKLLREDIPDAYTGLIMIPAEYINEIKAGEELNKKSSHAIKYLKEFKNSLYPIEKEILSMLETLSKKHPDLTLQELLQLKYNNAEQILIKQQSSILNKISEISKNLPRNEFLKVRKLLQSSYNKIFMPDPLPEERFGRKNFIFALRNLDIKDENIKQKMLTAAEKLPQSNDSINAFIVKYSQPYKLIYNPQNDTHIKIPRDSEELGLRLLMPSVGTDDHIHPQTAFKKEEIARQNGDPNAINLSKLKVSILTTKRINELKSDTPIDKFIEEQQDFDVQQNIQNHIKRLEEVADKWLHTGRIQDASTLADYIVVLQKEFQLRSEKVEIDLTNFNEKYLAIKEKAKTAEEKRLLKRLKKTGHADNSHKEAYVGNNGHILENRKVQKHSSRFE